MPSFYVLAINSKDSSNIQGARVDIKWTSGLGADLGTDTYYTDNLGRALVATPKIFLIPTGASGRITVTSGSLLGEDVADVNAFGMCTDHVIVCSPDAGAVATTTVSGIANKIGSAAKTSAWFVIGIVIALGVLVWGVARLKA